MTPFYLLLIGVLVTWRVTHLLVSEPGPWDIFGRLRRAAGSPFFGELVNCFDCLSLWIAAPLAIVLTTGWRHRLLLWPALSAGAILWSVLLRSRRRLPRPCFSKIRRIRVCCGAKPSRTRAVFTRTAQPRPHSFSSSSAQPSAPPSSPSPQTSAPPQPASLVFEYTGPTGMTVVSPTTGKRYRFDAPGAQLTVDARDQAMLLYVPNLRPVRFAR